MNIFLTSKNPIEAARHLDDLRLNKMILETAQILSQAFRVLYFDSDELYKDTHINHPCCVWARENEDNFTWLFLYFRELAIEKFCRSKKLHASWKKIGQFIDDNCDVSCRKINIEKINFNFNCTDFKNNEVTDAYRKQLIQKWSCDKKDPTWKKREFPDFYKVFKELNKK